MTAEIGGIENREKNQWNKRLVLWKKSIKLINHSKTNKKKKLITSIRNEIVGITTDPPDTKRGIGECCEQLHTHKLDNLEEIGQFLENHKL